MQKADKILALTKIGEQNRKNFPLMKFQLWFIRIFNVILRNFQEFSLGLTGIFLSGNFLSGSFLSLFSFMPVPSGIFLCYLLLSGDFLSVF